MSLYDRLTGLAVDKILGLPRSKAPIEVQRDIAVPMPDGAVLLGDHYRPSGVTGPMPVVLIRLPYGRGGQNGVIFGGTYARNGFQVFIQSTRGTFGSGGRFQPFADEREDGLATLAWVREQAWCDGRVAMTGGSYFGHTQWAIAPYADPPLVCISPHVAARNEYLGFNDHGAPGLDNAIRWSAAIGRQERSILPEQIPNPVLNARIKKALNAVPLQAADLTVAGAPVAFWRDFVAHPGLADPFWDRADHSGADLGQVPPANMVTGWWDVFLPAQLDDFHALQAAGIHARLVVGPWLHGELGEAKALMATDLPWLDHHLNGGPEPTGAPVQVFLQEADTWLEFQTWPPPGTTEVTRFLRAGGQLSEDAADGPATPSGFTYDPSDPTPTVGGAILQAPGKQADNGPIEARSDVLTFTGPPLATDLDLVGAVTARVYLGSSVPYADVFVRLCEVTPGGTSLNVVDGIRRLDPATVPASDVAVLPDGVLAVDIELFPTAYRIKAGHRLRVQVSGGAFPRFARNFGTSESFATATSGTPCRFTIHHDADHQSSLIFSQLPNTSKSDASPSPAAHQS